MGYSIQISVSSDLNFRKIRYRGGVTIDAVNGVVIHYADPPEGERHSNEVAYEHPYDDSIDAKICPICHGDPWGMFA